MINPVELAQELIRCRSVTPADDGAIELLQAHLQKLGFACEIAEFSEPGYATIKNLYARYGTSSPNICFAGHTDVVPVGDVADWKFDPFSATIADGVLYGRGAVDMKTSIACFAAAAAQFIAKGECNGSISFLITGDEEDVAVNGTQKLLKHLQQRGEIIDACIVGEPTNPKRIGEMIKIGRRGSVTFNLEVEGVQGHVAYPNQARNPLPILIQILHDLAQTKLDDGNEFFQPSNLEIVNLEVGNKADNVIPARAQAQFNIRFNDAHTSESLTKLVEGICAKHYNEFKLSTRVSGESFLTAPGELSDLVKTAVKEVLGVEAELSTTGGTSDARFIKDYCPVVEFGLINKTAHKVDEGVDIKDIESLTKIYLNILENYFN